MAPVQQPRRRADSMGCGGLAFGRRSSSIGRQGVLTKKFGSFDSEHSGNKTMRLIIIFLSF